MANGATEGLDEFVNESERESELEDLRSSAQRGWQFGSEDWVIKIAKQVELKNSLTAKQRLFA